MRHVLAAVLAIVVLTFGQVGGARADASCPAAGFVKSAGQAYDRAASIGSPAAFASAADRFSDLRSLALFALGQYRKDLPKAREAEYMSLTRKFIGQMLKDHGSGLTGGELTILDCVPQGGGFLVTARSASGSKLVFRITRAGGGYSMKDVNMQGIWLAQQMRSKFVGTISRTGSIDGLLAYLGS